MWIFAICFSIFVVSSVCYKIKKCRSYWKQRGILHEPPIFPFGNIQGFSSKSLFGQILQLMYEKFIGKDVIFGMHFFTNPCVVVLDPELIKNILIRDFDYFVNRGMYFNDTDDPLSAHLFSLEGNKWRGLRSKLSPTFTSGKMKFMFDIMVKLSEAMSKNLAKSADNEDEIEFRDVFSRYGTDVIGNTAFGIHCNSISNPDNEFRRKSKKSFEPGLWLKFRLIFAFAYPKLARKLSVKITDTKLSEFFTNIVRQNIEYRKVNQIVRNDFFQLLMEMEGDNVRREDKLSIDEITAQAFLFFAAGLETTSTVMSFCLYELGRHHSIQEKLRSAIDQSLEKNNGQITYESVNDMKYLNQVINETLRLYPPAEQAFRQAEADYKIPNTMHVIEKGTTVFIPIFAMHRDARIYPNPLEFNPDRFCDEEVAKRHPFTFLPFGEGPRVCIGMRFAKLNIRLGLIGILRKYKFSHSAKTPKNVSFIPSANTLILDGGTWLKIQNV